MCIEEQFSPSAKVATSLLGLVPSVLCSRFTIPVTLCECERSASTLRRLNNYMRASMGKDRLSHLALFTTLPLWTWTLK